MSLSVLYFLKSFYFIILLFSCRSFRLGMGMEMEQQAIKPIN